LYHVEVALNQRHAELCLSRFEVLAVVIAETKVALDFSPCRHLRRPDFSFYLHHPMLGDSPEIGYILVE